MFESIYRWIRQRRGLLVLAVVFATVGAATACDESLDGGAACPVLCPSPAESFRDTTFGAVVFDTTLSGFPSLGLSSNVLLANRPDTLVTRAVFRFDVIATSFYPNDGGTLDSITAVDSVVLKLPLDTTGSRGSSAVTIDVFDVDTTESDSVSAVVASLFRPDRRIGSVSVVPELAGDTLLIPLPGSVIEEKIAKGGRLRVGLQISIGTGQLRLTAFTFSSGAPVLQYDPATDSIYKPVVLRTSTSMANAAADLLLAYQAYSLVMHGSPPIDDPSLLVVGGYPASRSYLRFEVPARITDSSTIVRADLLLTQVPSHFGNPNDSVAIVALVPTNTDVVTDMRRILDLAAEGMFAAIDTTRLLPSDSGVKVINVLTLTRTWRTLPGNVPRALAFRINREGSQPAQLLFFGNRVLDPNLRPRLRITYLPRSEFVLP